MGITKFIPSRSVLAGGLTGVTAWAIVLLCNHYNVKIGGEPISQETAYLIATALGGIVTNFVPDSIKDHARALDTSVENLAKVIPTTSPVYPEGKNGGTTDTVHSNQAWKGNGNDTPGA